MNTPLWSHFFFSVFKFLHSLFAPEPTLQSRVPEEILTRVDFLLLEIHNCSSNCFDLGLIGFRSRLGVYILGRTLTISLLAC